jgi:tartrate dehydrogenase/decarboxylase / D-malate dehydrogenase
VAMIWSGALMLDFLAGSCLAANGLPDARFRQAHDAIVQAIEVTLITGPCTPDLGGSASTTEMGEAIAARVRA